MVFRHERCYCLRPALNKTCMPTCVHNFVSERVGSVLLLESQISWHSSNASFSGIYLCVVVSALRFDGVFVARRVCGVFIVYVVSPLQRAATQHRPRRHVRNGPQLYRVSLTDSISLRTCRSDFPLQITAHFRLICSTMNNQHAMRRRLLLCTYKVL